MKGEYLDHPLFPETDFTTMEGPRLLEHVESCAITMQRWESCIMGLIYEIDKRRLYDQADCSSIYEYGNKLGLSDWKIKHGLIIGRKIDDVPFVKHLFQNGLLPWTKLRYCASLVTTENQGYWIKQMRDLSRDSLIALVRQYRGTYAKDGSNRRGKLRNLKLTKAVIERFGRLHAEVCELRGKKVTMSRLLDEMLDVFQAHLARETEPSKVPCQVVVFQNGQTSGLFKMTGDGLEELSDDESVALDMVGPAESLCTWCDKAHMAALAQAERAENSILERELKNEHPGVPTATRADSVSRSEPNDGPKDELECVDELSVLGSHPIPGTGEVSRYIPKDVQRYVDLRFGGLCARPGCGKRGEIYHHIDGFSAMHIHLPNRILPLCPHHNRLVHEGIETENDWGFGGPINEATRAKIDLHFRIMRQFKRSEAQEVRQDRR